MAGDGGKYQLDQCNLGKLLMPSSFYLLPYVTDIALTTAFVLGYGAIFAIVANVVTAITSSLAYKLKKMDEVNGMLA